MYASSTFIQRIGTTYQKGFGGAVHTDGTSYMMWTPAEDELCTPVLLCFCAPRQATYTPASPIVVNSVLKKLSAKPCVLVTNGSEGMTNFILKEDLENFKRFFHAILDLDGYGSRLLAECGRYLPRRTVYTLEGAGFIFSRNNEAPSVFSNLTEELLAPIMKVSCGVFVEGASVREADTVAEMLCQALPEVPLEKDYMPKVLGVLPQDNNGKGTAAIELDLGDPEMEPVCALCNKRHRKARYYASINGHLCDVCKSKVGNVSFKNWFAAQVGIERERARSRAANIKNKLHGANTLCPKCGSRKHFISNGCLTLVCQQCTTEFYVDNWLHTYYLRNGIVYECDGLRRKIISIRSETDDTSALAGCEFCNTPVVKEECKRTVAYTSYICKHCYRDIYMS